MSAVVTLFSIQVCSRQDAGGAYAVLERSGTTGSGTVALQFSAGTWPKQLHGFNRFGFQQEAVLEASGSPIESAEFGFMTSSPEGNLHEARSSFYSAAGQMRCAISQASYTREGSQTLLERLNLPSRYSWEDSSELQRKFRSELDELRYTNNEGSRKGEPIPFLYAIHRAMLICRDRCETTFRHNGDCHRLEITQQADPAMGEAFQARGIAADKNAVVRLAGFVRSARGEKGNEFRLWFERGAANCLPLRIEFRPRSFLHLVLQCDPSAAGPPITYLMPEEQS